MGALGLRIKGMTWNNLSRSVSQISFNIKMNKILIFMQLMVTSSKSKKLKIKNNNRRSCIKVRKMLIMTMISMLKRSKLAQRILGSQDQKEEMTQQMKKWILSQF